MRSIVSIVLIICACSYVVSEASGSDFCVAESLFFDREKEMKENPLMPPERRGFLIRMFVRRSEEQNWATAKVWHSLNDEKASICIRDITLLDTYGIAVTMYSSLFELDNPNPEESSYLILLLKPSDPNIYDPQAPMISGVLERYDCLEGYCMVDVCINYDASDGFEENEYYEKIVVASGTTVTETYYIHFTLLAFTEGDVENWEVRDPKLLKAEIAEVFDIEISTETNVAVFDNNDMFTPLEKPIKICHMEFHFGDQAMVNFYDPDNYLMMTSLFFDFVDNEIKAYMEPTLLGREQFVENLLLEGTGYINLDIQNEYLEAVSIVHELPYRFSAANIIDFIVPDLIVPEFTVQRCEDGYVNCNDIPVYFGEGGTLPNAGKLDSGLDILALGVSFGGEVNITGTIYHEDGSITVEVLKPIASPIVVQEYPTLIVTVMFDETWWTEKRVKKAERIFLRGFLTLNNSRKEGDVAGAMAIQAEMIPEEEDDTLAYSGVSGFGEMSDWLMFWMLG